MAELKNPRHEAFAQNLMRGLTPTQAYVAAGFKRAGAAGNAARLMKTDAVLCRVNELRQALTASVLQLAITERNERLVAIQDRWDSLREAKACFARGDFEGAMKTGVVLRKKRWIGGKDGHEVTEYEINTALIECLNSVERRAAVETGQEVDRQDINLRGKVNDEAEVLRKAFTFEELNAMDRRMKAARNGKVVEAPLALPEKGKTSGEVEGGVTPSQASSWRD